MQYLVKLKPQTWIITGALTALLGATGCNPITIDPVTDPNNQSIEGVIAGATPTQLNALATGVEASLRLAYTNNASYNLITGVFGREVVVLASNEPRWTGEVLQGPLDNTSFYGVASYNATARVIRAANVLRQSAQAATSVTEEQKQGFYGFSDTYEALGKLYLVNLEGENGIRIDVANFLKPGKFTGASAPALTNIRQLLDKGVGELAKAGTSFAFPLSTGYADFDTPATFLKFNRALAARVALYQGDNAGALTALAASFYNPNGSLTVGPKLTFAPGTGGDQANPYYQVPNTLPSTLITVPDNFVTEAEANDLRLSKVAARTPRTFGGITSKYEPALFSSGSSRLSIIRNEELILISAEAKAKSSNLPGAVADINVIRTNAGGLPVYSGGLTQSALVDEVLFQRRYSLFYEGQFWVDLRRLGKLNPNPTPKITIPYSTGSYVLFNRLPIPDAEIRWDQANP